MAPSRDATSRAEVIARGTIGAWTRLGAAALAASGDLWARSAEIAARHLAGLGTPAAPGPAPGWLTHLRRVAPELAALPWLALERFAAELSAEVPGSRQGEARRVVDGRPLLFPVRTLAASQGFAIYPAPMTQAQRLLDERLGGHFAAIDVGHGRAAVELYVMDYRVSDLGSYLEFGVGVFAAPRANPLAVGLCVLEEPVNDRFACRAGIEVWGFPKSECGIEVTTAGNAAVWRVADRATGTPLVTLTLPRGGGGASTDIPLRLYTVLGGAPQLTLVRRTGRGERTRAGGAGVALAVNGEGASPLVASVRGLDIEIAVPFLHGWSEQVVTGVGAPRDIPEAGPAATA